jgi:non-ribosomal peptide synthetase component E (peptide arylation enzyme)
MKDLINRGGETISPVETDNALLRHPAVAEAAAFTVPHARLGDKIKTLPLTDRRGISSLLKSSCLYCHCLLAV